MKPEKAIKSFYSDLIKTFGGILVVHHEKIEEELIWIIAKNLHQVYLDTIDAFDVMEKIREENKKVDVSHRRTKDPHPAIAHILTELNNNKEK